MRQLTMKYAGSKMPVPECKGYLIRTYADSDHEAFKEVLLPLTRDLYWDEKLDEVILKNPAVRLDGIFFAEENGKLIGTATAELYDGYGTVHMVSALPEFSGRGVGRAVCTAVVNYLLDHGCEYVNLTTDDHRLPAIKTYYNLGFRPLIDDEEMQARWKALAEQINISGLVEEAWRE